MPPAISQLLTISIASKDRPEVVEATLRKIHAFGLGDCPLILCDDGSSPPLNPPALALFARGQLLRNEDAEGQAGARNRIAKACNTPYLLQFDDDSYPVAGSIESLLRFAQRTADWIAIAIPFEEPARGRGFPVGIPVSKAIQVRSFVGCSVLFDVKRFLALGGYAAWVGGMVEEEQLSIRALSLGYAIQTIDLVRVRHEVTEVSRNRDRITARSYRNWLLLWFLHAPMCVLPWRLTRLAVGAVAMTFKHRTAASLRGFFDGLGKCLSMLSLRVPVSLKCYLKFRRLPHALDFFK
jgi:GT2 family glycosyltransferase